MYFKIFFFISNGQKLFITKVQIRISSSISHTITTSPRPFPVGLMLKTDFIYKTYIFIFMQLFFKILSRMANSVDPDQTAPSEAV